MTTKIPILFLVFNRPNTTSKVFTEIRRAKPKILFIAADGPRENISGEKEKCGEVRKITEKIDWNCEVKRLYREKNLGCRKAVSSAIDWFFEHVDEGIILEDDCLPDPTFFRFCEEMLEKYCNNRKIMHIGGNNFQKSENKNNNSYYFSKYSHIWGWATWRRAWRKYRVNMSDWPKFKSEGRLNHKFRNFTEKFYWHTIFDAVYKGKIDTWDYQWLYTVWKNEGLCINPGVNLVENIGFGTDATHTAIRKIEIERQKIRFPLNHQKKIEVNADFDRYTSNNNFKHDLIALVYLKLIYL